MGDGRSFVDPPLASRLLPSALPSAMSRDERLGEWRQWHKSCQRLKDERGRAAALSLCHAMVEWLDGRGSATPEVLIRAALRARPHDVVFYASQALRDRAESDPAAWSIVLETFRRASIRACESILAYMGPPIAPHALLDLVELGVLHRSPQVRAKAVEKAYWWGLDTLPDILSRLTGSEKDARVLRAIECYGALHRDGFYARFDSGSWSWSIEYRDGEGICSADVPKVVVDAIGLEGALKHVKAHGPWGFVPWDEVVEGS